jgi:hypothetical protein
MSEVLRKELRRDLFMCRRRISMKVEPKGDEEQYQELVGMNVDRRSMPWKGETTTAGGWEGHPSLSRGEGNLLKFHKS